MRLLILPLTVPLLLAAAPQMAMPAHEPVAPCPAAARPTGSVGWSDALKATAATSPASTDGARIAVGKRFAVTLAPAGQVQFVSPPEKAAGASSFGGMVSFRVERAGRYRVALGKVAWIDVVQGGKSVKSIAHDHGAACSGIRKIVDFALTPGTHVLQLSDSKDASEQIMVTTLP